MFVSVPNLVLPTNMDMAVLLGVTSYVLVERCEGLGGTSTLRKEVVVSSETLVTITFTTRRHTPEGNCLHIRRGQNLKSRTYEYVVH
jgi:hypothetical protein